MAPQSTTRVLNALRNKLIKTKLDSKHLAAYIIPTCDAHQSEYISRCDERRAYISGFTGSLGTAVVTLDKAALWTDGRYYLQAKNELDENWILMKQFTRGTPSIGSWLCQVLPTESLVGVDPFLMGSDEFCTLSKQLRFKRHRLVSVENNLVDACWERKPDRTFNAIEYLDIDYTGQSEGDKMQCVRDQMAKEECSVLVLTNLDEIAWLFNLRGSDIDYNPVFFSYAVVTLNSTHLLINEDKLSEGAKMSLKKNVKIHPYADVVKVLKQVTSDVKEGKVWLSRSTSYGLVTLVPEERCLQQVTPVAILKAMKNETEISGARIAHVKCGTALCELFAWLSSEVSERDVTELEASDKLEEFRRQQENYVGPSFATISAAGTNSAVIHYNLKVGSEKTIVPNEIYLCDTGCQFREGTTDVTRTVHFGEPTEFQKECYTCILKGHISLFMSKFPKFIVGNRLDAIARQSLWDVGLDYPHGTGHGVGAHLNVHEGPIAIHFKISPEDPGMQPGMILSIEPGYYENENFGIRIENLAVVIKTETKHNRGSDFLTFDTLTLVPYQKKMILPSMLSSEQLEWLNNYHATCRSVIGKCLEQQGKHAALQWLMNETEVIHT